MADCHAGVLAIITEVLADVLPEGTTITDQTRPADVPGWDSLRHVLILSAVEERYDLRLSSREIDSLRSVGDLAALVEAKLGAR